MKKRIAVFVNNFAISAMGWTEPISLLANIMETKMVSGRNAFLTSSGLIIPSFPTSR